MLKIIGKIDITNNLVISYIREDLESFRSYVETKECEICRTKHERTSLWIIEADGIRKTAGTGCLKKFFGEAEYKAAYRKAMEEQEHIGKFCYFMKDALNKAYWLIQKHGFVSNKLARMNSEISTAQLLDHRFFEIEEEQDIADQVIEYFNNSTESSSYMMNCKSIASQEYIDDKCLSFIPAMVNSWIQHNIYTKLKEQNCNETEYFGEVGQRIKNEVAAKFIKEEYAGTKTYGYYPVTSKKLYFKTGNSILCWKTSSAASYKEDEEVVFKSFTIKSCYESKLGKITVITHPRF